MIQLKMADIREWTGGSIEGMPLDTLACHITIDSRMVGPNDIFVALPGLRTHGHHFIPDIWRAGGIALVERDYPNHSGPSIRVDAPLHAMGQLMRRFIDQHDIRVIGVTGSVGKTSVKELSAAVLKAKFVTGYSQGNYNTAIGLPLSFFSEEPSMTHFVAEMGMRMRGEIRHLTEIAPPHVAIITNIGLSHLETLGSIEAIQAAKGEILEGLRPHGIAVLNGDDPRVCELADTLHSGQQIIWYGANMRCDVRIMDAAIAQERTHIVLDYQGTAVNIRLPWLGVHHASNVAAAFSVGIAHGITIPEIIEALERVDSHRSRIRVQMVGTLRLLADVYNASPSSAKASLDVLKTFPSRRIAVLGDMLELGAAELSGHQDVGRYTKGCADRLLGVGSRARLIADAARTVGVPTDWVASRDEAFEWMKRHLQPGDTILLKASRGLEFDRLVSSLESWGGPA